MKSSIKVAQIDPNGLCNAGCWFCPVSYANNPVSARKDMPREMFDSILSQLVAARGDFVDESLSYIYTAHYNEVLLYKHFEEMLQLFRKYNLKTMILTNGTPLTPSKVDIISRYLDVVDGIGLNIPSSHKETWSAFTKKNEKLFDKVVENVRYAMSSLQEMVLEGRICIQINGINNYSLTQHGGWLDILSNAPILDLDVENGSLSKEEAGFKELFPGLRTYQMPWLIDRAGHLDKYGVITNANGISKHAKSGGKSRVIGCQNGVGDWSDRTTSWIHVNANGDIFLCCNDFDFETVFGNLNNNTLEEIWKGQERKDMIKKSFKSFCTTCSSAIWA